MDYILVAENEEESPVELPLEENGTLLLSTVITQFPGATGLKFTNPKTGAHRAVRLTTEVFHSPEKEGWGDRTYFCVFPKDNKRKATEEEEAPAAKTIKTEERRVDEQSQSQSGDLEGSDNASVDPSKSRKIIPKCRDLIVLGLPWETTDASLKEYFEKNYGEVAMVQVKIDRNGKSRGFGFVRFIDYDNQLKAMQERHKIDGRACDVSVPPNAKNAISKVFVGRLTKDVGEDDLREYFSELGDLTDVFIPKPFRNFGFVTFLDPEVARIVVKMDDHVIKGAPIHVEIASPKPGPGQSDDRRGGGRRGNRRSGGDDYEDDWRNNSRGGGGRFGGRNSGGGGGGGGSGGRGWNQGRNSGGGGGGGRRDSGGYDDNRGRVDLRGLSPSRLISAIKEAGLADALGLKGNSGGGGGGSGGGGYAQRGGGSSGGYTSGGGGGYSTVAASGRGDQMDDDDGYGRSYNRNRNGGDSAPANNWGGSYDRYN